MRALVYGLAVAGVSTARALLARGHRVIAADDAIDAAKRADAARLGIDLVEGSPSELVADIDVLCPAPGIPESHPIIAAARSGGIEVVSEIELAYRWEQERAGGPRPVLAITGTDGKTTTTDMTVAILRAAGHRAASLGNTDIPMVDGIDEDLDVLVVECTSFRLATTRDFRADAAVWLNLAPDHLNWHTSMRSYEVAKARIFDGQRATDVAIGFADDPVVAAHLAAAPGLQRSFGFDRGDYRVVDGSLTGPTGPICDVSVMGRGLRHDVTNALAAAALVLELGLAGASDIAAALATFVAPPHRLETIGEGAGVSWYNDSKATTPHAAAAAIRAFDSLVLIAGGSRKGADLSPMAAQADRVRAVVAIGETADEVRAVFAPTTLVVDAASMADAVERAAALAEPGDAVVLSPGCASFDWYGAYTERGDHFRRLVTDRLANRPTVMERS